MCIYKPVFFINYKWVEEKIVFINNNNDTNQRSSNNSKVEKYPLGPIVPCQYTEKLII